MYFQYVIFQEVHTGGMGEEWAGPEDLRALISSGTPFVGTMHPTRGDPISTAQYYREVMSLPSRTVVTTMGFRKIEMSHIGADGGVSLILECCPGEDNDQVGYIKAYPSLSQSDALNEILSRISDAM